MLVAMIFNVWLFISVILGLAVGYYRYRGPNKYQPPLPSDPEELKNIANHVDKVEEDCCA